NHDIDEIAFGPQAGHLIKKAREADRLGDADARDIFLERALEVARVTGCGGGACGLAEVSTASAEGARMARLLNMQPGDSIARDEERPCRSCHRTGGVYYVYNDQKVNKGCSHCDAVEFGVSK